MNEQPVPTLTTQRLRLQMLRLADAPALHALYQGAEVLRYFPNPQPPALEKVERFIAGQAAHWARHACGNWGVWLAEELIGWAGLQVLPELEQATEVGFLLGRPFWGRGYATEAARAALQDGFERLGLGQIIALVHPGNTASQRVLAKCGMGYVRTLFLWGLDLQYYQLEAENFLREGA